ncbi:hypothetical protein B0H17DRAFT_1212484 [Mycena rosella]|uniref:Uncharacterized protein n=1 Tax=Mycena rosella TaxID=1033263 RepID=A0AAD7CSH8_MYCRO|nr:hypothetical protein B0H17DRAFT_1212484 [Mycena rosella]
MSPPPPRTDAYSYLNDRGDGSPLRLLPYDDYDVLLSCPFAAPIIPPDTDELVFFPYNSPEEIHSLFFYNHWAFNALLPLIGALTALIILATRNTLHGCSTWLSAFS